MEVEPIKNLRIHLYGVQGSGSTFPSRKERNAFQELTDLDLLNQVFADMLRRTNGTGKINCSIEEILGGPVNRQSLLAYRKTLPTHDPRVYGGWTTCAWVETADGHDIVLDCGSGFRNCAKDLQAKWGERYERHLHIFGSHSHLDHTEGFDQAAVCFDSRNCVHVYGNRQFLRALDVSLGIFSRHVDDQMYGMQTPVFYGVMPAKFDACEIRDLNAQPPQRDEELSQRLHHIEKPVVIGRTRITAFEVFHPAPCLAYRFEHGGKVFVFCTDHELRRGADPLHPNQKASLAAEHRLRENSNGADLLYRDGQYSLSEYQGFQGIGGTGATSRMDWGHSCMEDVREMARECGVKRTLIGHHDPNRDWSERTWIDSTFAESTGEGNGRVELASAETVFDL